MFKKICVLIFLVLHMKISAQVEISMVPDSILSQANSVILEHQETLEVLNKSLLKRKVVSTILITKENTIGHTIYIPYDKNAKIDDIEISILSPNGKKRKTIKKKDMIDQSLVDNVTLATDVRVLIYKVLERELPTLVNIKYSKTTKESFTIESYIPVKSDNTSILSSNFTVINYDTTNQLRFSTNPWGKAIEETTNTYKKYSFQLKNISAERLKKLEERNISILITPILENFQMDGISGNLSSWRNLGLWFDKLGEGTDLLNEKSQTEIKQVIGDDTDKRIIIKKLYKYLQQNMRYVSIQLGIGGFKPMQAQDVHNYKYGDCKALSNYMKTILKVADISSNYIIISAGQNYNNPEMDFPQNVFNHAILAVPLEKDTIFLECTSTHSPMGYLGSFTNDRRALWINGEDSGLVRTKSYSYDKNIIQNTFNIKINSNESAGINFKQKLEGLGLEHHGYLYTSMFTNENFKEHIEKKIPTIEKTVVLNRNYDEGQYSFECTIVSPVNVSKSGSRYFVKLNIEKLPNSILDNPNSVKNGYTIMDYYIINIPVGCHVEKEPKDQKTQTKYVDIDMEITKDSTHINFNRKISLKNFKSSIADKAEIEQAKMLLKKAIGETIVINCKS